jgi:signal transduction histidine kinase
MNDRRSTLFSPLNCAAYLTWVTIFVGLLIGGFTGGTVDSSRERLGSAALMLVFLVSFVFLAWRETHARAVVSIALIVQAAAALALVAWTHDMLGAVLLIVVVAQAVDLPRIGMLALVGGANLGLLAILFTVWSTTSTVIVVFFMYLGFQAFAGLTGHYAKQAERSRDELAQVNAHLLATRSLLEESARDGERLRLARELHDVSGHKLTALKLQLALLARDPAGAPPAVATAAGLASELLDDLRGVVGQLRKHEGLDLKRAIEELAAPLPKPRVHIEIASDTRVDDVEQAQALLRTAQEALTNAARHSNAEHVWLTLTRAQGRIVLEVRDDGRGSAAIRPGNGLNGMRERLEAIGGGLVLSGERGFRINAWVPAA